MIFHRNGATYLQSRIEVKIKVRKGFRFPWNNIRTTRKTLTSAALPETGQRDSRPSLPSSLPPFRRFSASKPPIIRDIIFPPVNKLMSKGRESRDRCPRSYQIDVDLSIERRFLVRSITNKFLFPSNSFSFRVVFSRSLRIWTFSFLTFSVVVSRYEKFSFFLWNII